MDILVFSVILFFSATMTAIGLFFRANYLSVVAGIILILMGVTTSINPFLTGGLTQSFCVSDTTGGIICDDHALPLLEIGYQFWIAFGGMLMFAGLGVIVDSIIRIRGQKYS